MCLVPGSTWQRLAVPGSTWQYLAVPGSTWQHLAVPGSTWQRLISDIPHPAFQNNTATLHIHPRSQHLNLSARNLRALLYQRGMLHTSDISLADH